MKRIVNEIRQKINEEPYEVKIEKEDVNRIQIICRTGNNYSYSHRYPLNSGVSPVSCFRPFYRWFYERKSPYFTFGHNQGCDIIIRDEIVQVKLLKNAGAEQLGKA